MFTICLLILFFSLILCYNKFVLPSAIAVSQKYAVTRINSEISRAVDSGISQLGIKAEDFTKEVNSGDTSRINIDSLLINKLCSLSAVQLSESLNKINSEKISLPVGIFSGIPLISNIGIDIPIHLQSMGEALVDYDTQMKSAGINQVNYMIWLNAECRIAIVNPLWRKEVIVKRKVMLVDTILNGKVPEGYIYRANNT